MYEHDRRTAKRLAESEDQPSRAPREETRGETIQQLIRRIATLERGHSDWVACFDSDLGQVEIERRALERRLGYRRGSGRELSRGS